MDGFRFVSVKLTITLIAGIITGYYLAPKALWLAPLLILLLLVLGISHKRQIHKLFTLVFYSTTFALGLFTMALSQPHNQPKHYANCVAKEGQIQLKITQTLKENAFSNRYYATVTKLGNQAQTGQILLNIAKDTLAQPFAVADEIIAISQIQPIPGPLNPHQFNYRTYLAQQAIYGQIKLDHNQFVKLTARNNTLRSLAANYRSAIISKLRQQHYNADVFGVIQALLLGERKELTADTYEAYKNAGAVHILAVSGLHVGLLLLLFGFLLKPLERLPYGTTIKLICLVLILWSYAFIAGLSASVVRAVTMFSFLAYALYLNRPANTFNILALSMFFILLAAPLMLFSVGFQMSYAAVFAIVWIYPKLQSFWQPKLWLLRKVWQLLGMSVAAQLGVLPLSLFYFHQFPGLFFISNLVIVPFLGLILGMGILILCLTQMNLVPSFLTEAYNALISGMNHIIAWVAQQEAFLFKDISFDALQLVLGYTLIIALVQGLYLPSFKRIAYLLTAVCAYTSYLLWQELPANNTERLLLLHQTTNAVLLHQKDKSLNLYSHQPQKAQLPASPYAIKAGISIQQQDSLQNTYVWQGQSILFLDKTGVYPTQIQPTYLILTQSPKINLGRLIDTLQPKKIIADGSNYKSDVARWQITAQQKNIPFHYTGEKGYYEFR